MLTQNLAPTVHDLDHQYTPPQSLDVFGLAEAMRGQIPDDKKFDALVSRAWEASAAIDMTLAEMDRLAVPSMLECSPADLPGLVRQAAHDAASGIRDNVGHNGRSRADVHLRDQLRDELKAALPPFADGVVEAMRPVFDGHIKVVAAALSAGITQETSPASLAETGTSTQLKAYRALPRAVAGLEQIKTLRDGLTMTLPYGPRDLLGLAYVGHVSRPEDLETACTRYAPDLETAQYHQSSGGSAFVTIERERVGGRWLHMLSAGLTLHLNTAAEVEALRQNAKAA